MKKATTVFAAILTTLVMVSFLFAQVDTKTPPTGSTGGDHLMGDMSSLMSDMSGMMKTLSGMMKDMNPEKRKRMTVMIKDLSKEMKNMSDMIGRGMTDREIEMMHVRMSKIQKVMSEMETKK